MGKPRRGLEVQMMTTHSLWSELHNRLAHIERSTRDGEAYSLLAASAHIARDVAYEIEDRANQLELLPQGADKA